MDGAVDRYDYFANQLNQVRRFLGRPNRTTSRVGSRTERTPGSASYTFDGAGSRSSQTVNGQSTSFTHDPAGRLLSTQADGRSTSYEYDGLDRRTSTTDRTQYGTNTTDTVWDGFDPVATASDLYGATNVLRDPLGAVAFQDGPHGAEWVLGDQRNATATAGDDGQITDLVDYADFGGAEYESTGWASLVGNDQQPGDPTLGLDNYYARDYDFTTGTWVQPDDWRGLLVRPQSLNRYAYIENTPVSFSDDLGYVIKMMRAKDLGGGFAKQVVRHAFTKATAAKSVTNLNRHVARDTMSKSKSFGKKITPQSPRNRSASFTSATHMDKCSVFEIVCNRSGGRETVYCSDNILGTIAQATCTMDYRPETLAAKAIDVLLAGVPVGAILSRGLQLLLRAKASATAAKATVTATRGAENAADGVRLRAQLTGEEIADGHAFKKHVIDQAEYPGITTKEQFAQHIENVVINGQVRNLDRGRTAYWYDGTVVIRNPGAADGGTAFRPTEGYDYFLNLR